MRKQTKKIKENVKKVIVAPGGGGKWKNWQSDLYLEEKLFPALFPYGIGGFLSSNMLRQDNMGFANYVKNRLLSADAKFRKDPSYVFFLLLVKEISASADGGPPHKESLELFGCFRGLKQHLFGVFRGLKYGRTFLEFSGALNSQNKAVSGA